MLHCSDFYTSVAAYQNSTFRPASDTRYWVLNQYPQGTRMSKTLIRSAHLQRETVNEKTPRFP